MLVKRLKNPKRPLIKNLRRTISALSMINSQSRKHLRPRGLGTSGISAAMRKMLPKLKRLRLQPKKIKKTTLVTLVEKIRLRLLRLRQLIRKLKRMTTLEILGPSRKQMSIKRLKSPKRPLIKKPRRTILGLLMTNCQSRRHLRPRGLETSETLISLWPLRQRKGREKRPRGLGTSGISAAMRKMLPKLKRLRLSLKKTKRRVTTLVTLANKRRRLR